MFIFYIQFQLRLVFKKIQLALLHFPRSSTSGNINLGCLHRTSKKHSRGLTLLSWSAYITDVNPFKDYPLFPKHSASVHFAIKPLPPLPKPMSTAGWRFGLLFVVETGQHRFALSSDRGSRTVQLSKNSGPERTRVLARLDREKCLRQFFTNIRVRLYS